MHHVNWGVGIMIGLQDSGCWFVDRAGRPYSRDSAVAGGSVCVCNSRSMLALTPGQWRARKGQQAIEESDETSRQVHKQRGKLTYIT
jgi:hypothetical protein